MSSPHLSNRQSPDDYSWSDVIRQNDQWIREVLYNRLHSLDEVEEVAQEIELSLMKSKTNPGDVENPSAWLYRVAIRQVLMYRRKKGRYRKLLNNNRSSGSLSDEQNANPLALLMRIERVEKIQDVIQQLHETDREVLMLKYSENWTYRQLAEKLGVSTNTIEHRLVKAKKTLRKLLTNADGEVKV